MAKPVVLVRDEMEEALVGEQSRGRMESDTPLSL